MKKSIITGFVISCLILLLSAFSLEGMAEEQLQNMMENGHLPEKYLTGEGWIFDYTPLHHFLILASVFIAAFYLYAIFSKGKRIYGSALLLIFFLIGYLLVSLEFIQLATVTFLPMAALVFIAYMTCIRGVNV